jgi:hypothetical protein
VECVYDPDAEGDIAVVLGEPGGPQLRLWNPVVSHDEVIKACADLTVRTETESLRAAVHGVTLGVMGEDLTSFLAELEEHFAGWDGVRTWQNLDRVIEVGARHVTGGYVDLEWTLRSRPYFWVPPWSASATVRVEAGEQMRRLTADMYRFLHPA